MEDNLVLLVEDDAAISELLRIMLEGCLGVPTVPARDGKQALQQARVAPPTLVLLDLVLPEIDGIEVARQLRADPVTRSVPLIALTGLHDAQERALAAGCDDYLEKPFDLDRLLEVVRKHLSPR